MPPLKNQNFENTDKDFWVFICISQYHAQTYLLTLLTLLRGYLGFFGNLKVLGLLNVAVVLTLRDFLSWTPLSTFFLAFSALSLALTTPELDFTGAVFFSTFAGAAAGFFSCFAGAAVSANK